MQKENENEFSYDNLSEKESTLAKFQAGKIHGLLNDSTSMLVGIGQSLLKVHQQIGKPHFQSWLKAEFEWSQSVASNYMQIAKRFGKLKFLNQFQPSALRVLVRKNVPERAMKEAIKLARSGETITHKRAQELIGKHTSLAKGSNGRTERPVLDTMPVPTDLDALRDSLVTFCDRVESIAVELPKAERESLADRLLELALTLRTVEDRTSNAGNGKPTVRKPKSRTRSNGRKTEPVVV